MQSMETNTAEIVGSPAPSFTLSGTADVSLADFRGKSPVLIYFMREFACHTCLHHVLEIVKDYDRIQKQGVEVLVIGGGNVDTAKRFAARYKIPFTVLADPSHSVYDQYGLDKAFGVWQKSGSYLIDVDGVVRYAKSAGKPSAGLDLSAIPF